DVGPERVCQGVDQRVVGQKPIDIIGGHDAERHAFAGSMAVRRLAAASATSRDPAGGGPGGAARSDPAAPAARPPPPPPGAAAPRHLCCLSQDAMPPTQTPRATRTKISR